MKTSVTRLLTFLAVVGSISASPMKKRTTIYNGNASVYDSNGFSGACGEYFELPDASAVVALSNYLYNNGSQCYAPLMVFTRGNDSQSARGTVVDIDEDLGDYDIALSPALFEQLAPLSEGTIEVVFDFPDEL